MLQTDDDDGIFDQFIRSDSVMVSEWGLQHTLKLRDEGKQEDDAPQLETVNKTTPPRHIKIENTENNEEESNGDGENGNCGNGDDDGLPLPSTPVINSKPSHETDWWSNALAENGGVVDDYDSLIESLESKESSSITERKVMVGQYYCSYSDSRHLYNQDSFSNPKTSFNIYNNL